MSPPRRDADPFTITPLEELSLFRADTTGFCSILAEASADRLGAYSGHQGPATPKEIAGIRDLFMQAGPFNGFQLDVSVNLPPFSSWFYGVAWDWCLVATWPAAHLAWAGCLTDTD